MSRTDGRQWSDGAAGPSLEAGPDLSWMDRGACAAMGPAKWDALTSAGVKAACSTCPVRDACLAYALDRGDSWGWWGGLLFEHGRPRSDPDAGTPEGTCDAGHPWTDASTIWNDRAHTKRQCGICRNERARTGRPPRGMSETCDAGHPWTEASTIRGLDGTRRCRICKNANERRWWRERQKAVA